MQNKDLFRLKIEAEQKSISRSANIKRRPRWLISSGILGMAVIGLLGWAGIFRAPVEVQSIKVSNMFVARALTVS